MYDSCLKKQQSIKEIFLALPTEEAKYEKIIEMGRQQKMLDAAYKNNENLVKGCQSQVYLYSQFSEGKVFFEAESDALISSGLAALLTQVYSGEAPETILKCPPTYLDELGVLGSISPNRANGLYSIHLKMKQDALKLLIEHPI